MPTPFSRPALLLLSLLPLLAMRCHREADDNKPLTPLQQLPPATSTGAQTFGCLINGTPFVVRGNRYHGSSVSADWSDKRYLSVSSVSYDFSPIRLVSLQVVDTLFQLRTGVRLNLTADSNATKNSAVLNVGSSYYERQNVVAGWIEFSRLDRQARIVSGTFEFTMARGRDTVRVTNGRFDIPNVSL